MKNYPSKFYKLYESSHHFHDWHVSEVRCRSNEYINRKKSDTVILSLCDSILLPGEDSDDFKETNWEMEFNNVKAFRFDCYAVKSDDVGGGDLGLSSGYVSDRNDLQFGTRYYR